MGFTPDPNPSLIPRFRDQKAVFYTNKYWVGDEERGHLEEKMTLDRMITLDVVCPNLSSLQSTH